MFSRRQIVQWSPLLFATFVGPVRAADDMLNENDSDGQAIDYRADARKVDRQRFAQFRPGQRCGNCAIYTAEAGADHGAGAIVFGKFVSADGWCSSYEKKPE